MSRRLCALMMILPLLAGCSGGEQDGGDPAEELALQIRTEYLAMTACAAAVEITADYGQRVYEYAMTFSWQKDGETLLTVVSPENIAGITAHIRDGSTTLEYDGASLETGQLSAEGLSPMEAVPALLEYIFSGFIAECDLETVDSSQQLWICCREPENSPGTGTEAAFWFDADSHALVRAEVLSDGYTVIQCVFTEFTKE